MYFVHLFIFLLFIDKTLIATTLVGFVGKVNKLTKIGRYLKQRVCVKVIKSVVGRRGRSRTWKEGLGRAEVQTRRTAPLPQGTQIKPGEYWLCTQTASFGTKGTFNNWSVHMEGGRRGSIRTS